MNESQFCITEWGQVYRLRRHHRPELLGGIACLVREETPLGREVRAWWHARLASDEQGENIVFDERGDFSFVRVLEGVTVIIDAEPAREPELDEAALVAGLNVAGNHRSDFVSSPLNIQSMLLPE